LERINYPLFVESMTTLRAEGIVDAGRAWPVAQVPWSPVAVSQGGKPAIGPESSIADLGVEAPKQFGKMASDSPLCLLDI
jgi:hypothetical protein